jgi:hypothetical protein
MFCRISLAILFFVCASAATAQSGRIKPNKTPTPVPRPRIVYPPVEITSQKPQPKITPTPKIEPEDDDVIRVESALVPIPVSVTDQSGKAITNLKLEDFELLIDGKAASVSDLSRSDTPVRLRCFSTTVRALRLRVNLKKKPP